MKVVDKKWILDNYKEDDYIWYVCYGSNLNYDRFMLYINGDETKELSSYSGCKIKNPPIESGEYIIDAELYFALESKRWTGGIAFIDYETSGKVYGKKYKIQLNQFLDILKQERVNKNYDTILYLNNINDVPVFTFTAEHKLKALNKPNERYYNVIKQGLLDTYSKLTEADADNYLNNCII